MGSTIVGLLFLAGCGGPTDAGSSAGSPAGPSTPAVAPDETPSMSATPSTSSTPSASPESKPSSPAPKIAEELRFSTKTLDGKEFSGESLAGKPAVLWFWAPWCPVCQREAPTVAKVVQDNPEVTFVGVAAQDQLPAMQDFVSKHQVDSFAHLADLDASIWTRFGVTYQPAYAFISPDGTVDVVKSSLSEEDLTKRVGALAGA